MTVTAVKATTNYLLHKYHLVEVSVLLPFLGRPRVDDACGPEPRLRDRVQPAGLRVAEQRRADARQNLRLRIRNRPVRRLQNHALGGQLLPEDICFVGEPNVVHERFPRVRLQPPVRHQQRR